MQPILALSLTHSVNNWLENSQSPRVLHVFDRASNLINDRKEVLSIVTPQIGNGPFNLVIEDDVPFLQYLNIESPVSIHDNQLIVGALNIYTVDVKLWSPNPDWEKLHLKRDDILNQLTELQIIAKHLIGINYQFTNSLVPNLSSALVKADISFAKNIASKLAGLGIGLTPSGDDLIMGALYAAWIIHPAEVARMLAQEIANTAASLTTSLSAAWLRSAGRGEAGILWHTFFDALMSSEASQIKSAMEKILAVGATSGADALAGFIGTFTAYMELEKKHVIPKFF